ncbi:MAG: hypothetical protein NPIRA04_17830 [Nitrospirales bacterium]|nr:MAG: hypothetical protein NPIRA04_17830 [Nitrospirales bacterium]
MIRRIQAIPVNKPAYTVLLLFMLFSLSGCEDFGIEGPRIRNGFSTPIKIHILFKNGETRTGVLPAGAGGHLGIQGMSIKQVQIYQNEVLKIEIPNPKFPTYKDLKMYKDNPKEVWFIDENGIHPMSVY